MEQRSEYRGRIQEVLELIADADSQLEYQRRAPHVDVAAELFNQWDDAYHPADTGFREQFGGGELAALAVFSELIERVADETPRQLPALEEFMSTEHWRRLASGAAVALAAMDAGRMNGLSSGN